MAPWYINLKFKFFNRENIVYFNAAYLHIPTNNLVDILADIAREYGPAVAGSIYLLLRVVYHLNEYVERTQFNYRTIPNFEGYMDSVGSGRVTNLLFPGVENYINRMHGRVNDDLYRAFLNAAEAFNNPDLHIAINNLNPEQT